MRDAVIRFAPASHLLWCVVGACTYQGSVGLVCPDQGAPAACDEVMAPTSKGREPDDAMVPTSQGQARDDARVPPSQGQERDDAMAPTSQGQARDDARVPPSQGQGPDASKLPTSKGQCRGERPLTLTRRELTVFMSIDSSVGMSAWWMSLQNGFNRFIADPESEGVNLGLAAFSGACMIEPHTQPGVAIAPLPSHRDALQSAFPDSPGGIYRATVPRLIGAHQYARKWSVDHPQQDVVVLFVTFNPYLGDDCVIGLPQASQIAQERLNDPVSVPTWVLGLDSNLDSLAAAGGSGKALIARSPQYDAPGQRLIEMRDALRPIDEPSCRLALPSGERIDLERSRLRFALRDGGEQMITNVAGRTECAADGGGFYQRDPSEAAIVVCPSSCDSLRDVEHVDLLTECSDAEP